MNKTKIEWCDYTPRGKKVYTKQGYVLVYCPEHPNTNKNNGKYILEHRLVMSNFLKRPLLKAEHVHHKNGIKADNRIENLQLTTNSNHRKTHMNQLTDAEKKMLAKGLISYAQKIKLPRTLIKCACGCGQTLECRDSKGRERRFIHGHNTKGTHWKWRNKAI